MHRTDDPVPTSNQDWEDWQFEYQHGVFLLLPPTEVAEAVNQLRWRYDPRSAAICDAHVTLSEPLLSPLTGSQLDELRSVLGCIPPLGLTYGPVTDMGRPPGVVYAISPSEPFFELRRTIHGTSASVGHRLTRAERAPHMTVAEFITIERTAELLVELRELPSGTFRCDLVVLAAPDESFHVSSVLSIPLGG